MVSSVTSAIDQFGNVAFSGGGQKYTSVAQGASAGTVAIAAAVTGGK